MALCFAYSFVGLMLPQPGIISWQGHLSGFVAGLLGGWLFRDRRRPRPLPAVPRDPAVPQGSTAALLKEIEDLT
ncbi:hypothetical protein Pta02_60100 [Planobispora takensis]|uniref:Peptidase S54 rhomboid domain-containing protein n=2 Tax=Planobispora takensis TaxID=1367882 RepID=A0A8J3T2L8_9ACTN|nr:hypothetical protein Pta02_60100 [Planobispora takensis]